jgi:aspartyl-tRNA(Asn)/glutamyl-tRNA(Gln) amidotransferase subunit B
MNRWQPVIGLEIHAQLQTARKLFSATRLPLPNASPNTAVTWYDAAMPGTLPRLNANALRQAIKAGIGL